MHDLLSKGTQLTNIIYQLPYIELFIKLVYFYKFFKIEFSLLKFYESMSCNQKFQYSYNISTTFHKFNFMDPKEFVKFMKIQWCEKKPVYSISYWNVQLIINEVKTVHTFVCTKFSIMENSCCLQQHKLPINLMKKQPDFFAS